MKYLSAWTRHACFLPLGLVWMFQSGCGDSRVRVPPQTMIATVDVSGSMGWDYSSEDTEYPQPGAITRRLLRAVASRLHAGDQLAIVTYGSSVDTWTWTRGWHLAWHLAWTRPARTGCRTDAPGGRSPAA